MGYQSVRQLIAKITQMHKFFLFELSLKAVSLPLTSIKPNSENAVILHFLFNSGLRAPSVKQQKGYKKPKMHLDYSLLTLLTNLTTKCCHRKK